MVINFSGLSGTKSGNEADNASSTNNNDAVNQEFLENLITRICHDLAGCVSSVNNSIDYLNTPDMKEQAEQLLRDSSNENLRKLQLYRIAFGTIRGEGAADLSEFKQIASEVFDRIELDWSLPEMFLLTQNARKIMANILIALNSVAVKSCAVLVGENSIKMNFEKVREDSGLSLAIEGKKLDYTPQNVQFYYLGQISDSIKIEQSSNELEITF